MNKLRSILGFFIILIHLSYPSFLKEYFKIEWVVAKDSNLSQKYRFLHPVLIGSAFKTSDQVQGQGVPRIENGAYTSVREYFNPRDNAAIGPQMGF
jgi:hypothetical protein